MNPELTSSRPSEKTLKDRYELVMRRLDALEEERTMYAQESQLLLALISHYDHNKTDKIDEAREKLKTTINKMYGLPDSAPQDQSKKERKPKTSTFTKNNPTVKFLILDVMSAHPDPMPTKEITKILLETQPSEYWTNPNIPKLIGSTLCNLERDGTAIRVGTGIYALTKKGEDWVRNQKQKMEENNG